ncbi:LytR family transcriptional attenuator [Ornithinimicrobium humiphilum]|uniref:LytR family transcriptional attenuator n=1 Tax=Ornithinimicrobium humiphilum TaxID=125288 RepID=A0A543KM54_9MICO|nr:LCP family protein [Ornithinimicrobium humiphilum]TQM96162.1 LytR family transcriptional attenuator [Ornithinimicrobium humiphilum]
MAPVLAAAALLVAACTGGDEPTGPTDADDPVDGTTSLDPAPTTDESDPTTSPPPDEAAATSGPPVGAGLPEGPLTALVVGTDGRGDDPAGRADVVVVAQLSADHDALTLVSVPRDCLVEIPGVGPDKVNAAWALGGAPLLEETVSDLLGGLEIDLVATSDFVVFEDLTRWLGGFEVVNRHASTATDAEGREVVFPEGRIRLEGAEALAYVRQRQGLPLGDLDRAERHRAALLGMTERLAQVRAEDPARLLELLPLLRDGVDLQGDLGLPELLALVEVGSRLGPEGITSLSVPITGFGTTATGASVNLLDEARLAELAAGLREGDLSGYVATYGAGYAPTGG